MIVVLTVVPASDRPETGVEHTFEHLLAFGLVGLVFSLAYSWRPMVLITSGIVFALLLELAQIPHLPGTPGLRIFLPMLSGQALGSHWLT